jgi:hypothetical protein
VIDVSSEARKTTGNMPVGSELPTGYNLRYRLDRLKADNSLRVGDIDFKLSVVVLRMIIWMGTTEDPRNE